MATHLKTRQGRWPIGSSRHSWPAIARRRSSRPIGRGHFGRQTRARRMARPARRRQPGRRARFGPQVCRVATRRQGTLVRRQASLEAPLSSAARVETAGPMIVAKRRRRCLLQGQLTVFRELAWRRISRFAAILNIRSAWGDRRCPANQGAVTLRGLTPCQAQPA